MNDRRLFLRICFILAGFGLMSFLALLSNPAFSAIRGVDVVRLIGIGMCFGGAIISLVAYYRDRR